MSVHSVQKPVLSCTLLLIAQAVCTFAYQGAGFDRAPAGGGPSGLEGGGCAAPVDSFVRLFQASGRGGASAKLTGLRRGARLVVEWSGGGGVRFRFHLHERAAAGVVAQDAQSPLSRVGPIGYPLAGKVLGRR